MITNFGLTLPLSQTFWIFGQCSVDQSLGDVSSYQKLDVCVMFKDRSAVMCFGVIRLVA